MTRLILALDHDGSLGHFIAVNPKEATTFLQHILEDFLPYSQIEVRCASLRQSQRYDIYAMIVKARYLDDGTITFNGDTEHSLINIANTIQDLFNMRSIDDTRPIVRYNPLRLCHMQEKPPTGRRIFQSTTQEKLNQKLQKKQVKLFRGQKPSSPMTVKQWLKCIGSKREDFLYNDFKDLIIPLQAEPYDASKFLTHYMHMHEAAAKHPFEEITYQFWDDNTSYSKQFAEIIDTHPWLIPDNITFAAIHFCYDDLMNDITTYTHSGKLITGTGKPNPQLHNTILDWSNYLKIQHPTNNCTWTALQNQVSKDAFIKIFDVQQTKKRLAGFFDTDTAQTLTLAAMTKPCSSIDPVRTP